MQFSIAHPTTIDLSLVNKKLTDKLTVLHQMMDSASSSFTSSSHDGAASSRLGMRKFKKFMKESKVLPFIIVGILFLILLGFGLKKVLTKPSVMGTTTTQSTDGRVQLKKPIATESVKKEFSFPLKDTNGKEVSRIKLVVVNIELRDQIIIQGKIANTTVGKNVLIANLELTNNYTKPISINSRNYFRLKKNNDTKLYDPKIHNDPIDVQPVSTTSTRIGFTVDDTDSNFILRVGDVTDPTAKIEEFKITNLR